MTERERPTMRAPRHQPDSRVNAFIEQAEIVKRETAKLNELRRQLIGEDEHGR